MISGTAQVGAQLSGSYTYSDAESNSQGTSTFRWVSNRVNAGVSGGVDVAATQNYTVVVGDLGKYLYFCVTPVASAGTTTGTEVCSSATAAVAAAGGPGLPEGSATAIPTLSEWGMLILAGLMGLFGMARLRHLHPELQTGRARR